VVAGAAEPAGTLGSVRGVPARQLVMALRQSSQSALSRVLESEPRGGGRQAVIDALQKAGRQVFNGWP